MGEEIPEHHHRHRHKVRRVRRRTGLRVEDYLFFALALIGCMLLIGGILWLLNRPHLTFW